MIDPVTVISLGVVAAVVAGVWRHRASSRKRQDVVFEFLRSAAGVEDLEPLELPKRLINGLGRMSEPRAELPGDGLVGFVDEGIPLKCIGAAGRSRRVPIKVAFVSRSGDPDGVVRAIVLEAKSSRVELTGLSMWTLTSNDSLLRDSRHALPWRSGRLRVASAGHDSPLVFSLLSNELADALIAASTGITKDSRAYSRGSERPRASVRVDGRRFVFVREFRAGRELETLAPMVRRWLELMDECLRAVPRDADLDARIAARVRDPGEHTEVRWRAVGQLIHGGEHLDGLYADIDAFPDEVQIALASRLRTPLPDQERRGLLVRGLEHGVDLGGLATSAFIRFDPWAVFADSRFAADVRSSCARDALAARQAPEDDAQLESVVVPALNEGVFGARLALEVFEAFVVAGWSPTPDALAQLAPLAKEPLARAMISWIARRGVTLEHVPALQTLYARGHEDRVEPLFERLKKMGAAPELGRLSIAAPRGARGAISPARPAGGLSGAEEE